MGLKKYEKENSVNLVIKKSIRDADNPRLKYKLVTFLCKHHGQHEKIGDTRQTKSYQIGCKFYLTVQQKPVNGVQMLVITSLDEDHNHDRSADLFKHMPKQRKEVIEEKGTYLKQAFESRSNFRILHNQVNTSNASGGIATLKDLYNAKVKYAAAEQRHESDLVNLVNEMLKVDSAVVKVFRNEDNELDSIFFQDERMRAMFSAYPDVLLFNGTYKLNDRRMSLVVVMVIDGNGESQVAGFFIVRSENENTFRFLFREFKHENPNHDEIEVIISDKSFANRNTFQAEFPNSQHQLCVFHVLQIFEREITTAKRGITPEQRKEVISILIKMVYAESRQQYNQLYRALQNLNCPRAQEYFDQNRYDITEQWVGYLVDSYRHYENRTNNRLEELNQKIKSVVTKYANLAKFFNDLIILMSSYNVERDHVAADNFLRRPLATIRDTDYDKQYALFLTYYAYSKYKSQSNRSDEIEFIRISEIDAQCIENNMIIDVTERNCSCRFFQTMHLPCAHIIKFLVSNGEDVFNETLCAYRWKKETAQFASEFEYVNPAVPSQSQLELVQVPTPPQPRRNLTPNEKFRSAEKMTKKNCETKISTAPNWLANFYNGRGLFYPTKYFTSRLNISTNSTLLKKLINHLITFQWCPMHYRAK